MISSCKKKLSLIEETLNTLVSKQSNSPHAHLFTAARYSLLAKSKRLRPLLTILTAEDLGANIEAALTPACALELIHTYSLIHDDLPCMDDDDFRRGKPSLHVAFGEGPAVLTGDFLLTFAFQVLAEAPALSDSQKIKLIQCLSKHAGSEGMIGGQVADLSLNPALKDGECVGRGSAPLPTEMDLKNPSLKEGASFFLMKEEIDWNHLQWIHAKKTGGLFSAALEFGGIISKATNTDLDLLRKAGLSFGIAFQILDDLKDAQDSPESAPSALSTLGQENASSLAFEYIQEANQCLDSTSKPMLELKDFFHSFL